MYHVSLLSRVPHHAAMSAVADLWRLEIKIYWSTLLTDGCLITDNWYTFQRVWDFL